MISVSMYCDLNPYFGRKDGVSMEVETQLRIYGCEVIQEGGILLRLPQAVMATAQVLLQRFYMKQSLRTYNIKVDCRPAGRTFSSSY